MNCRHSFHLLKTRLFYGWYIVLGLATVGMVSVGMGGINMGLFLPPMSQEIGIPHAYFGWAFSARLIGFSVTGWYIGVMLDRYGARIPMAVTGLLAGLVMIGMSRLQSGWQMIALYFVLGLIGMQGAGGNLYQVVPISRWFIAKRGKAMSMAFVGTTAGIFVYSPLTEHFIATIGWRSAWLILGCSGSMVVILVALLVIRKDPQSMGLQPDGIQTSRPDGADDNVTRPPMDEEYSWTRPEALRTFAFWSLVLVFGLSMLGISTLHVFRIPFYIEQGIAPDLVAWAVSIEALVAAAASIVTGRIVDRVQPRFVVAGSFLSYLLMLIVTMNLSAVWHVYVSAALFGISAASYIVAQNTLWPVYFGSVHIGSIRGVSQITALVFSTIGAPISGMIKDTTGSYMPAWIGAFILISLSLVLMLGTKKPRPPAQSNLDIFRDTPVLRARFPERPG